ncbi:MAG TPA: hypothetical protein DET40_04855 [Lentisphaeria bacterium]|nr:MAG: hypothetical protein A2X45_13430 [Lentisphaerae bacterium GWF2_50_93]HCE42855.1 hypothetical protein [Lentisphaeria bacterium]
MTLELYKTFCEIDTTPEFDRPDNNYDGGLVVLQELSPWGIINLTRDYKVELNDEHLSNLITGRTYVLEMLEPSRGLLLVMRKGYGWSWSFSSETGSGDLNHYAQKLVDEWIDKVAGMNINRDIPGQMSLEFEKREAV